jgi:hypothetical protein
MTGRARCWVFPVGPAKAVATVPSSVFSPRPSRALSCFESSCVSMCTIPRTSTYWWATKPSSSKPARPPMTWLAPRCPGWPSPHGPWLASSSIATNAASKASAGAQQATSLRAKNRPARPEGSKLPQRSRPSRQSWYASQGYAQICSTSSYMPYITDLLRAFLRQYPRLTSTEPQQHRPAPSSRDGESADIQDRTDSRSGHSPTATVGHCAAWLSNLAASISDQRTLVRSYSTANLLQQLIIPHKSLDPFAPTAVLGEHSDLEQLRDRVAG